MLTLAGFPPRAAALDECPADIDRQLQPAWAWGNELTSTWQPVTSRLVRIARTNRDRTASVAFLVLDDATMLRLTEPAVGRSVERKSVAALTAMSELLMLATIDGGHNQAKIAEEELDSVEMGT